MERAIEVMLVEVLTNLFRDNPPQPRSNTSNSSQSGNSSQGSHSSQGGNSSSGTGAYSPVALANGPNLQRDGAEPADGAPADLQRDDAEPVNEAPGEMSCHGGC